MLESLAPGAAPGPRNYSVDDLAGCLGLCTLTARAIGSPPVSRPSSLISSSILHPLSRSTRNIIGNN